MSQLPFPNQNETLFTRYDWVTGGTTPLSSTGGLRYERYRHMPINQVNKKTDKGKYPPGGDWYAIEYAVTQFGDNVTVVRPGYGRAGEGLLVQKRNGFFPSIDEAQRSYVTDPNYLIGFSDEARSYGPDGFAKARPDRPIFSMSNSLLELREIPKMLKNNLGELLYAMFAYKNKRIRRLTWPLNRANVGLGRRSAENFLAIELGWIPLYNDIKNYLWSLDNLERRLVNFIRHAEKPVKRRRTLKDETVVNPNLVFHGKPWNPDIAETFVTQCYGTGSSYSLTTETITDFVEFVGEFTYYLPFDVKTRDGIKRLGRKMMGFMLSPSLVWNLIPFTWLVDYGSRMGDYIEMLSPESIAERQHITYGYIIRKKTYTYERECSVIIQTPDGQKTVTSTLRQKTTVKSRWRVHPFGVLRLDELTPRQIAISAAIAGTHL